MSLERPGSVRAVRSDQLDAADKRALRDLLDSAYGPRFDDDDWGHALGGMHFLFETADGPIAHAAVVPRVIRIDAKDHETGYVEAVATRPDKQGLGFATRVMREVGRYIRANFELGALATGENSFYERVGWITWLGETFVRTASGAVRTPDDDGCVMVMPCGDAEIDLTAEIACFDRPGDVW